MQDRIKNVNIVDNRYGASDFDWINFDLMLGLTEDMLPVVSNLGAVISPGSSIKSLGKTPSCFNSAGQVVGINGWTQHRATHDEINVWAANPDYGICLQTRSVRALDVDITDPNLADQVEALIARHIPGLPKRHRANSSKFLVAFRLTGEYSKRRFSTAGDGNAVEFLATGQQFIAAGTNPSGVRYEWQNLTDFPVVDDSTFEVLWDDLVATFAQSNEIRKENKARRVGEDLDIADRVADYLWEKNFVLGESNGKLLVECPWNEHHTTGSAGDSSTVWLLAGTNGHAEGHFNCQHNHCAGQNRAHYLEAIGYIDSGADDFETIVQEISNQDESFDISKFFSDLTLQDEDVKKMAEAEFLIPDMIVRGHIAAYVAPGNGGKTTLFIYLCEQLVAMDLNVFYINVDGSPGDLKRHFAHAAEHGYKVVAPDAKDGKSTQHVLEKLQAIARSNQRIDNVVFIIDTLKKFVDVISKREAKEFYKLMRSISVRGGTVCLLGHCNKYRDENGRPVFEGTADLRNDLDELIYLNSVQLENPKRLEVTTDPDKKRADFSPKSYIIYLDDDRQVVESAAPIRIMRPEVRVVVELIKTAITEGNISQKAIVLYVTERCEHGQKKVKQILHDHTGEGKEFSQRQAGRGRDLIYSIRQNDFDPVVDL